MPKLDLYDHDLGLLKQSAGIIGVDEAGRGALAGPVVAAAFYSDRPWLMSDFCSQWKSRINDSKQMASSMRLQIYEQLEELKNSSVCRYAVGVASVQEIDEFNILGATTMAMNRSIQALHQQLQEKEIEKASIIVDGKPVRKLRYAHQAIVKGDGISLSIALASILAKVSRDLSMQKLATKFPGYGFENHMGYGTKVHRDSILEHGPSVIHRPLFLRKLLSEEQTAFDFGN